MRKIFIITFALLLFSSIQVDAQLVKYAQAKKQELAERKRLEQERYNRAISSGSIDLYREFLELYPKGKHADTIRVQVNEYEQWERAKSLNTIAGYERYLSSSKLKKYQNEARQGIKNIQKQMEKTAWNKAVELNTIVGYETYIRNSQFLSYKDEAERAISELKSLAEWNRIENSDSKLDFENFISSFPNSSRADLAIKRCHEFDAVFYYEQTQYEKAYTEFNKAGGADFIRNVNKQKYMRCFEEHQYSLLNTASSNTELRQFLTDFPSSSHYDAVSNMLALNMSQEMTMYSGSSELSDALAYARDEETKFAINQRYQVLHEQYLAYKEEQRREQNRQNRAARHRRVMANGGYVMFGLEPLDFAYATEDDYLHYNIGLSVKFGNFHSPIQFEVGAKFGYLCQVVKEESYYYYSSESEYKLVSKFHLPLYAKLKLNLGGPDNAKWYISGLGFYNAKRVDDVENEFSVGGGLGVAWRHWDWLILYYKQDVGSESRSDYYYYSDNKLDYKYIGTSLVYYF